MKLHPITRELLAAHEAFRRMGFWSEELVPVFLPEAGQICLQASYKDRQFLLDIVGGRAEETATVKVIEEVHAEWPAAATWWNEEATHAEHTAIWKGSASKRLGFHLLMALGGKGFPLGEMKAREAPTQKGGEA